MQMGASFGVHREDVGPQIGKGLDVPVGVDNHQVHVQRLLGMSSNGLHHGHAKTDVGHKHAVHHIEVEPMRIGGIDPFHIALKVGKIGGEKRRCKEM